MKLVVRRVLFVLSAVLAFSSVPALAQTGPELALKPFPKELALDLEAEGYLTDQGHSKQTGESLTIGIVDVQGRIRLSPGELTSPRIGFEAKYFNIDSDIAGLPNGMYDYNVGFATPIGEWDKWIIGVSGAVGYAGQTPFADGNGWYGRANLLAFRELDETSSLVIGIDFDGNRTFKPDTPLPGFAYLKRIDKSLTLTVGIPVTSIEWSPPQLPDLRVELAYLITDNFRARVGYEFIPGFELFGLVGQRTDAFYMQDQEHSRDRLLFQQRRAEMGLTYRTKNAGVGDRDVELTIAGGYAWDGELSVGFDSNNSKLLSDLSDEPYLRLAVQVRF